MLSAEESLRYSRHFVLPGFGEKAQLILKKSSVLVVGCGGLGSPVILYLTAAGIGKLGLVDFDSIELSNLQRQVLFNSADTGLNKAQVASKRIKDLNPFVETEIYKNKLSATNALDILKGYDLIIDGTDNFPTRYLINDACVLLKKPFIYGSIFRFEGQVSVFNLEGGPTYRDIFPKPPDPASVPNCEQGGVLGVLPGIIGSLQANEAIKVLTGTGEPLSGKLLIYNALSSESRIIKIKKNKNLPKIDKLIDYDEFCQGSIKKFTMKEITVQELKEMIDSGEDFQLLDVREPHEYEIANLKGELIPRNDQPDAGDKIARDKKVIVHCRSGARSAQAIRYWGNKYGLDNLYNLKGGILAWADEIDTSMTKY